MVRADFHAEGGSLHSSIKGGSPYSSHMSGSHPAGTEQRKPDTEGCGVTPLLRDPNPAWVLTEGWQVRTGFGSHESGRVAPTCMGMWEPRSNSTLVTGGAARGFPEQVRLSWALDGACVKLSVRDGCLGLRAECGFPGEQSRAGWGGQGRSGSLWRQAEGGTCMLRNSLKLHTLHANPQSRGPHTHSPSQHICFSVCDLSPSAQLSGPRFLLDRSLSSSSLPQELSSVLILAPSVLQSGQHR